MIPTGVASAAQIYHKLLEIYELDADRLFREAEFNAELSGDPDARVQVKLISERRFRPNRTLRHETRSVPVTDVCRHSAGAVNALDFSLTFMVFSQNRF